MSEFKLPFRWKTIAKPFFVPKTKAFLWARYCKRCEEIERKSLKEKLFAEEILNERI